MSNSDTPSIDEILSSFMNEIEWSVNPEMLSRATVDREKEASALEVAKALLQKRELEARRDELRQLHATYLWNESVADYSADRIDELTKQIEELASE